ncbi:MAG: hypothetical protein WBM41_09255 [Arenicellales bacterium]
MNHFYPYREFGYVYKKAKYPRYLNDSTFLITRYRYEWFFDDLNLGSLNEIEDRIETVADNRSDGNHVFTVGLGFRF